MSRMGWILTLGALIVIAGIGYWLTGHLSGGEVSTGGNGQPVVSTGTPQIGGPFTLVNQDGQTVTQESFDGKYLLIYFGFTYCPDVCPTDLAKMAAAMDALGDDAKKVQPIFITIDPERDTPEQIKLYIQQFDPRLVGLTGSPEQIAAAAKAYRAQYDKVKDPSAEGGYTMEHTPYIYFMSPDNKFLTFFVGTRATPEEMAKAMKAKMD